jgi:hypothetical protein
MLKFPQFILDLIDLRDESDIAARDQLSILNLLFLVYVLDHLKSRLPGPCLFRTVRPLKDHALTLIGFKI